MLKSASVPSSDYENNFESIDKNKHRNRFETFTEDEYVEDS